MAKGSMATQLPAPGDKEALYILDVSAFVFRAYHALPPLSTSTGEPTHAVHGFASMLKKLVDARKPARLCVALDPGKRTFRSKMFPEYKANRPPAPPDLKMQMKRCYEILEAYDVPSLVHPDVEADDIIATVVERCKHLNFKTVIVSADKDMLQLVNESVVMFDPQKNKVFGIEEATEKMGVPPHQVRDMLALMGDSSDNIPGVPSVGKKTAQKLLLEYGSIDGVYAHLDEITRKSLKAKLTEFKDQAYLSRDLVQLKNDVELDVQLDKLAWTGGTVEKLRPLFVELELTRMLDQLEGGPSTAPKSKAATAKVKTDVARLPHVVVTDVKALAEMVKSIKKAQAMALFCAVENRDAHRGEWIGLGISDGISAYYVPFSHRYLGAPEQLEIGKVAELLGGILADASIKKRSDDLKRDRLVLLRHGLTLFGDTFDTSLASYLIDAGRHAHGLLETARRDLGRELLSYDRVTQKTRGSQQTLSQAEIAEGLEYGAGNAEAIWQLSVSMGEEIERDGFRGLLREVEIPLAEVLAAMERVGVCLDTKLLAEMSEDVRAAMKGLEEKAQELAGKEFNLGSPRQLETILFDELKLRVVKKTKTARSTDQEVLEELTEEHALPAVILEWRALSKLRSTYVEALPKQVDSETKRVHTVYNQAVAATGRLSSSDPNLQNIPIRTELGRKVRHAFVAQDGWEMMSADYSQVELRVLAHLSGDPELVEAYSTAQDVHVRTASALFDVEPKDVTREQRGQGKTVNFAVIYGQSAFALARNLSIPRSEAARYIKAFFERYAGVKAYMDDLIAQAKKTGGVYTFMGRRRRLPDLVSKNFRLRSAAERIARNTPIQGSAADIMKVAMVRIHQAMRSQKLESNLLLTVHDELVFEAPAQEKDVLTKLVIEGMEQAARLKVPLVVDHGWGHSWGDAH